MSEMVERLARALRERVRSEAGAIPWPETDGAWEDLARAALQAMREPTEAMLEATWPHEADSSADTLQTWHEMVDEALR